MPNVPVAPAGPPARPALRAELRGALVLAAAVMAVAGVGALVFAAGFGLVPAASLRLSALLLGVIVAFAPSHTSCTAV